MRTPEVREILTGDPNPPPPPPEVRDDPPAVRAGRTDYPQLLSAVLRHSDWRSPQTMLLGKIVCRSPDPLTAARVGRYEIWHREVRLAILGLSVKQQRDVWRYLHADAAPGLLPDGTLGVILPALSPDSLDAFAALWRSLAERGWLHTPTRESKDGVIEV